MMADLNRLYDAILNGDAKAAAAVTREALDEGNDPLALVTSRMVPAMDEVGKRFECGDYFVPEILLAARAMKAAMELLRPLLSQQGAQPVARVAIGTVQGDLHDIGKNLVAAMLEGGGFEIHDLGNDVPSGKFVAAVKQQNVDLICLSALLTVTMQGMKTTIDELKQAGLRDRVKVLVGGAPLSEKFAQQIGADGDAENASAAVALARRLVRGQA